MTGLECLLTCAQCSAGYGGVRYDRVHYGVDFEHCGGVLLNTVNKINAMC